MSTEYSLPQVNQKIRLVKMEDPYPVQPDTIGVVKAIATYTEQGHEYHCLEIKWIDSSAELHVILPGDQIELLEKDYFI